MNIDQLIQARLDQFSEQCLSTSDTTARAWVFRGGPPSPGLRGHHTFGTNDSPLRIHLLDLYHGRAPTLVNLTTLRGIRNVPIGLGPKLILDSNAISYVSSYLNGRIQDPLRRQVVEEFIRFVLERHLDSSIVFYLLESLARSDQSRWREQAAAYAETLFDMQTLDRELFLRERILASSIENRKSQMTFKSALGSTGLMDKYLDSIPRPIALGEEYKIEMSYAALLKATLLQMEARATVSERLASLGDFMIQRLGAVLSFERFLATLHWLAPERFARLMTPLQRGARIDRLLSKLRSTSWDLYLGRLPEQLGKFVPTEDPGHAEAVCDLYYVATGEDTLAELLRHRTIEMLIQYSDSAKSSILVGHHPGVLVELTTTEHLDKIALDSAEWERRAAQTAHLRKPVRAEDLNIVVAELEAEIHASGS